MKKKKIIGITALLGGLFSLIAFLINLNRLGLFTMGGMMIILGIEFQMLK